MVLLGDVAKVEASLLHIDFNRVMELLIKNLELPENGKFDNNDMERLSVCNNSCWTLGIVAVYCGSNIEKYLDTIIRKLLKILCVPKVLNINLA